MYPFRWLRNGIVLFLGAFWILLGIGVIYFILAGNELGAAIPWLVGWGGGAIGIFRLVREYFTKEIITIQNGKMSIGRSLMGLTRGKSYDISQIRNIRPVQVFSDTHPEKVCFNYTRGTLIHFGKSLTNSEAQTLATSLADILRFACHETENIVFGKKPDREVSLPATHYNPDVTALTFPYVHLKRIIIDTETYDFHLIERFLTYAINTLGQAYLKHHVTVELLGSPEKLHPNLRNNLTHLCHQITLLPLLSSRNEEERSTEQKPLA